MVVKTFAMPVNKRRSFQNGACSSWLSMTQKCLISKQTPQGRVRFCKLISTAQMLRGHLSQFSELNKLNEWHPRTRLNKWDVGRMIGQSREAGAARPLFFSAAVPKFEASFTINTDQCCLSFTNTGSTDVFFMFHKPLQFTYLCHVKLDKKTFPVNMIML